MCACNCCLLSPALCCPPSLTQEMLFSMYSPTDEEGPASPTHGSSANTTERQGLLAAGNGLGPPLSSR